MLKKTNPKIKEKLMGLQGGIADLIQALGYTDVYTFSNIFLN